MSGKEGGAVEEEEVGVEEGEWEGEGREEGNEE